MKQLDIRESKKKAVGKKILEEGSFSTGTDSETRLHWLVGFAQETDVPETAEAIRTLHQQLGDYLNGVLIRRQNPDHGNFPVITLGDPLNPDELPMAGEDNHKLLDEKVGVDSDRAPPPPKGFSYALGRSSAGHG